MADQVKAFEQEIPQEDMAGTPYYFNWLSRDFGVARIRQKRFGELVLQYPRWDVDFGKGTIRFGEEEFPVGFLGSESDSSNTWLWGWVNINHFPENIVEDSEAFYEHCMMMGMEEIKEAELDLTELVNGHALASMAVVAGADNRMCYYRAPYDGGAAFLLVKDVPDSIFAAVSAVDAASAISESISDFPLQHHFLVEGVMEVYCKDAKIDLQTATGIFHDGSVLAVEFDEQQRIAKLTVQ